NDGITSLGRRMLAFPVHPRYGRMLLAAQEYGCVHEACLVAALTQGRDVLVRNPGKEALAVRDRLFGDLNENASSDFYVLIHAWNYAVQNNFRIDLLRDAGIHAGAAREVGRLYEQFLRIARDEGLADVAHAENELEEDALRRCVLIGFSDRVARVDPDTL